MAFRKKDPIEKVAKLEEEIRQKKAQLQRERALISVEKKRMETRRKIIAGALALEHKDAEFQATLTRLLNQYVKASDRHLFDLPPLPEQETPPSS